MKQFSEAFGRKLEGSGITRIQWIALYYIHESGSISQRELSHLMCVKDSSAGRLVDRLERDNMVRRLRSTEDRRVIKLELTSEGDERFASLIYIGKEFNDNLTKGIKQEDLDTFENVLKAMLANIQE